MPDREKVIKGLKHCLSIDSPCGDCPYYSYDDIQELECERNLRYDALALLKEQEEEIENLKQTAQSMMEGICLLKEQNNCENCAVAIEDRQPVVRCRDCKWYSEKGFCKHPNGGAGNVRSADWFCADGERKEGR